MIQRPFPFLASCPAPKSAPREFVMATASPLAAARVAIRTARLKQAYVARALGISPAYLSMILSGERNVPDGFPEALGLITGSRLMEQRLAVEGALKAAAGESTPRAQELALAEQLRRVA